MNIIQRGLSKLIFLCLIFSLSSCLNNEDKLNTIKFCSRKTFEKEDHKAIPLNISPWANRSFADPDRANGPVGKIIDGYRTRGFIDLKKFHPPEDTLIMGIPFSFASGYKRAIVLGKGNKVSFPKSRIIPIEQKAAGLYILHTSNISSRTPARYTLFYGDKTKYVKLVKRNEAIFEWDGVHNSEEARSVWSAYYKPFNESVSLYLFAMPNPYPEKEITGLKLEVVGDDHQILIAAVSLSKKRLCLPRLDSEKRDLTKWFPQWPGDPDKTRGTVLDVSRLLDAPAGKHGALLVHEGKFVFEDGTPARFWGGNVYGEGCFPDKEDAVKMADKISQAGANIVRLHHLDVMKPWSDKVVKRSLFGGQNPQTTRVINSEYLDKFQFFFNELKKRGIYIYLSHTSSRNIAPEDGFPGTKDALKDISDGFKIEGFFDPYLIKLQEEFLISLLSSINPYTGLTLAEDPAMVFFEITNENSMLYLGKEDKFSVKSEYYQEMLLEKFNCWLSSRYSSTNALKKAWCNDSIAGLFSGEKLEQHNIDIPFMDQNQESCLTMSDERIKDTYRFLFDLQQNYYNKIKEVLDSLHTKALIVGSNHWTTQLSDIYLNAQLDFLDRHIYWAHPSREYNYMKGQIINSQPMVKSPFGGSIGGLAMRRVYGKPFTVSEWHNCLPNPYRAEGPILMSAYGCLQDWNLMQYAYFDGNLDRKPDMINSFDAFYDPANTNLYPAAALIFQRQDVEESPQGYYEYIPQAEIFNPENNIKYTPSIALVAKYGLMFENLSQNMDEINDTLKNLAGENRKNFRTVTGQIDWNTKQGLVTLDTKRSQGIIGFPENQEINLSSTGFKISTEFAVVVINSLTDEAIENSSHLLISSSARARWTDIEFSKDGDRILKTGRPPFLVQPVEGRIWLNINKPLKIYSISENGERMEEIPVQYGDGKCFFDMDAKYKEMHYEVVSE